MFLFLDGLSPSLLSRNAGVTRANLRSKLRLREPEQESFCCWKPQQHNPHAPRRTQLWFLSCLTSRGRCVFEQLVKLTQVHHHRKRVWLSGRRHLLCRHQRRNAKLSFCHVQTEPSVVLRRRLVQRVKVTETDRKWAEGETGSRDHRKSGQQKRKCSDQPEPVLHDIGSISMNQRTQSQTTLPGSSQVLNCDPTIATGLFLTPGQQLIGLTGRVCQSGRDGDQSSDRTGRDQLYQRMKATHPLGRIWGRAAA